MMGLNLMLGSLGLKPEEILATIKTVAEQVNDASERLARLESKIDQLAAAQSSIAFNAAMVRAVMQELGMVAAFPNAQLMPPATAGENDDERQHESDAARQ